MNGHTIVGPNDEPTEPEHECANCGAAYHGRGAALECCSEDVRCDGGRDRPNPERLPAEYSPAFVQVPGEGKHFVADYAILSSDWVRVTEWSGTRVKYPPARITAIREVQTEGVGEMDDLGYRSQRVADESKREEARDAAARAETQVVA